MMGSRFIMGVKEEVSVYVECRDITSVNTRKARIIVPSLVISCSTALCVFFTFNRYIYPSTSSTTSVRADSSIPDERYKRCGPKTTPHQRYYIAIQYAEWTMQCPET